MRFLSSGARGSAFSECETEQREGVCVVAGGPAQSGGDVVPSVDAQAGDGVAAEGGQGAGCVAGADAGGLVRLN